MHENLQRLNHEISTTGTYTLPTVVSVFVESPKSVYRQAYRMLVEAHNKMANSEEGFVTKKVQQGYTRESACRALAVTYLLYFLGRAGIDVTRVAEEIPDVETARNRNIEALLI